MPNLKTDFSGRRSAAHTLLCLAALLLVFLSVSMRRAVAQIGGTGSMQGTISDPSGAVVPGASVTATNDNTNAASTQQTTSSGLFSIVALPAGPYTLTVTAKGFQVTKQEHVVVDALGVTTVNLTLNVGGASDVVTISAAPPAIDTTDATLGEVMRNEVYTALPLAMNAGPRDPTAFVALVPGVQALSSQAAGSSFASFNGGQPYMNEVYIEGIPMTNAAAQGETRNLAYSVSVEAIDQFQVETNNSPAEYQGQGIENYTIKSGSNAFHGAGYEYFRNTVLDARGYFPTFRQPEKQNQFGARVGGFIFKDKLFFFGNYDGYRYRSTSNPTTQFVPTAAMQAGDFSAIPQPIYDPLSTTCNAAGVCTRTQFSYQGRLNVIPPGRLSPVSQSLQSYLPALPPGTGIGNNYTAIVPVGLNTNSTTDRLDYDFSQRQRFYAIFSKGTYTTVPFAGISANTSALPLPYAATRIVTEDPTTIQFHHVLTVTPNLLNQFGYSYARLAIPITSATASGMYASKSGLAGLPPGQASDAFPTVNFSGPNAPQSWAGTNSQAYDEVANTYVVQDNVQWVKGKHSITTGGQYSWLQDNYTSPDNESNAAFNFTNTETGNYSATGALLPTTGNAYASYLLGANDSATIADNAVITTGARYKDFAVYAQDAYRVLNNLTLNIGLRYDILGPFHEAQNRQSFLNPTLPNPAASNYPGALQFSGSGPDSCNCATPIKTDYKDFGPRVSLAYSPNPRTSVRAGFAIMYAHGNAAGGRGGGRNGTGQLGYDANPSFTSVLGNGAPAFFWSAQTALPAVYANNVPTGGLPPYQKAPFFDPTLNTGFCSGPGCLAAGGAITFGDPDIGGRPPAFNNYTLSVQQAFTDNLTLTLAYSGSQGHYLPSAVGRIDYANQINPAYLALGNDLNLLVTSSANVAKYNTDAAAAGLPAFKLPFANYTNTFGRALTRFPQYSSISDIFGGIGNSNYNSLQVTVNQRLSHGLTFNANYVWSREIDDVTGSASTGSRTVYNTRLERSIGNIDRTNLVTSTATWDLPFGKGHRFGASSFVSPIVSGFELSSLILIQSGAPLAFTGSCTIPFTGGECPPNLNPTFAGSPSINGGLGSGNNNATPNHNAVYLNAAAFTNPAPYTFGNAPRNAPYGLRAPYVWDQDITVRRTFSIWENLKLQAAVSAFNIYNTVNFGLSASNTNITNAAFGQVSSQSNQPRKLQGEARITF